MSQMDRLSLGEEEEEEVSTEGEEVVEAAQPLRLVGRFLTDNNLRVQVMKDRMADVWRPGKGVVIEEVEPGLFVFEFFHQLDIQRILKQGPWSFDRHLLVLGVLPEGVSPGTVPLHKVLFWVQVHDVPTGFMAESVGRSLGNFVGEFLEYDAKNSPNFWRPIMRIRVQIDVRVPLKRSKKIKKHGGEAKIVTFKYERLEEFCYLCGVLGHIENFCPELFNIGADDGYRGWGPDLKAESRRGGGAPRSKFLREKGQEEWVRPAERYNSNNIYGKNCGVSEKSGLGDNDGRGKRSVNEVENNARHVNVADIFRNPQTYFPVKQNSNNTNSIRGGVNNISKEVEDMETEASVEIEKRKRQRGEAHEDSISPANSDATNGQQISENSEAVKNPFLSAGPGRQACREQ